MTLLLDLKNETRPEHVALENDLNFLSEKIDLQTYTAILKAFYGFYKPFESHIKNSPLSFREDLHMQERYKLSMLEADLLSLGLSSHEINSLPLCSNLPSLDSLEEIFGAIYVLEGSTLGGMVLTKHFSKKFDLENLKGLSFYNSYGSKTVEMWRNFQVFLGNQAKNHELDSKKIISSAKSTFSSLHQWLNSNI